MEKDLERVGKVRELCKMGGKANCGPDLAPGEMEAEQVRQEEVG